MNVKKKNILYVGPLLSNKFYGEIHKAGKFSFNFAAQKFHTLLLTGLSADHKYNIKVLSALLPVKKGIFQYRSAEKVNNIFFNYVPYLRIVGIKQLMEFFYTFFKVLAWSFSKGEKVIILDILILKITFPTLLAAKLCRIKCVAIVTDLPFFMSVLSLSEKVSLKKCIGNYIFNILANHYDGYVLLTEQMNEVLNRKLCPYIIMEGLVDSSDYGVENIPKSSPKVVLYAGSLFDVFGVKNLIEAFILLKDQNAELHLYGQGPMVKDISEYYCKQDNRIKFFGVVPSEEVVAAERKATLLVNPRSNKYEYTKYSFPSKNMEYMVSGTPLLGMLLPGMNKEYADYMFLIEDESTEALAKTLENILCMEPDTLIKKGESAKTFVLTKKNNIQQAARILDLINKI